MCVCVCVSVHDLPGQSKDPPNIDAGLVLRVQQHVDAAHGLAHSRGPAAAEGGLQEEEVGRVDGGRPRGKSHHSDTHTI